MKKLWWRFLDRFWPRYIVGVDPAYKNDYGTAVITQRHRDGTVRIVAVSSEGDGA